MFDGKNIMITGGSSGVGRVLAERFIKRGANLILIARDKNKLNRVQKELDDISQSHRQIHVFTCDVADHLSVQKTISESVDESGIPDILINSAGILRESYFENQSLDTFREVMDINFFGTLHMIKAVLPFFRQKKEGRIVNICSMAGLMGVFGYTAYCSSKHAIAGLTSALRAELKPQNVRIHLVCPPEFESPMVDEINKNRTYENKTIAHTIPVLSMDVVADAVIKGIEKDQYEIIPGWPAKVISRIDKMFPSITRTISDFRIRSVYKGPVSKG
ncbi:MAG: SDR family oxidoreductase [Proteobacteria bacterium]|nr:SDR family oxidoreductase [Pseudomonadota bacterium]